MTCGSWTLQVTPAITYPIRAYIQTYRPKVSSTAGKQQHETTLSLS